MITLPKPTLIVDSMEQKAYTFKPFRKWFAEIERRKLPIGDYSIAGLEDRIAVERKSLQDLFNCCSPFGSREAFVRDWGLALGSPIKRPLSRGKSYPMRENLFSR